MTGSMRKGREKTCDDDECWGKKILFKTRTRLLPIEMANLWQDP